MVKLRRVLLTLLLAILFAGGIFVGLYVARLVGFDAAPRTHNTPALLKQVQTLSQLVTVQYVIEKAVVWEDPPKTVLGQFFSGDNRILILANGIVKAGVDLDRLTVDDLQVEGKKAVIRLPAARITDAYLDDSQTKVIERSTGFLRAFDKDLEQNVRKMVVNDIGRAARRGGILKDAEERAQKQLAALFMQLGFEQVEFRSPDSPPLDRLNPSPGGTSETPAP